MTGPLLVALADAWGPRYGGVNAFNHDLCIGLASRLHEDSQLICAVPRASQEEQSAASNANVTLLVTESDRLDSGDIARVLNQVGYGEIAWWIGHDVITGPMALKCKSLLGGKVALIHHMNYLDYVAFKHG